MDGSNFCEPRHGELVLEPYALQLVPCVAAEKDFQRRAVIDFLLMHQRVRFLQSERRRKLVLPGLADLRGGIYRANQANFPFR